MYLFLNTPSSQESGQPNKSCRPVGMGQQGNVVRHLEQLLIGFSQSLLDISQQNLEYRDHLAGGRLVAISKAPKPGIWPIDVTDVWLCIAARGLLTNCLLELAKYFQTQHKLVFQFATATPNEVSNMFHLLHGIYTNVMSTQTQKQDPAIIVPLYLHNALNMETWKAGSTLQAPVPANSSQ